jgi:hypothetical protein
MAVCGRLTTVQIGGVTIDDAHTVNWTDAAPAIDVSAFGSGAWGDYLACRREGTLTLNTYAYITGLDAGDTTTFSIADTLRTISGSCVCTSENESVDAKGLVEITYEFRATGEPTES